MGIEAALTAVPANLELFGADQLARIEPAKVKALKLPGKMAYFQGGTNFHRVAVVSPLGNDYSHQQQLLAGLVWANKVSNGQKTILYMVGEGFNPVIRHMAQLFGPRVEVRLAYYTPKLSKPFLIAGKDGRLTPPEYSNPVLPELSQWQRKFNPVETGWFLAAVTYFQGFSHKQVEISFLDNWVSVKFQGVEVVRISKKENRLRVALITRYPRENPGNVGNREEKEGWFNTSGQLNSDFTAAFEQRICQLAGDPERLARICSEKQRLEYLLTSDPRVLGLGRIFYQLDVGKKGKTDLIIEILSKSIDGNLITAVVHPHKDLAGLSQCLEQLIWSQLQYNTISKTYFPESFLGEPESWLVCPQAKLHPEVELIKSLLWPEQCVKLVCIDDAWADKGIIPVKTC